MSQPFNRRWLPRFSLKTFLLFCVLGGSGVAWVSHTYSEYLAERRIIEALTKSMPPGSLMTVVTNGETTWSVGNYFMWDPDSTSVVVNYQGPEAIRGLVEVMEIPIFNRVSQINYRIKDLSEIQLDKEDVARMHRLELILVSKRSEKLVDESDVKAVGDIVPPCRLASVDKTKNQINIKVNPGSTFVCSSR